MDKKYAIAATLAMLIAAGYIIYTDVLRTDTNVIVPEPVSPLQDVVTDLSKGDDHSDVPAKTHVANEVTKPFMYSYAVTQSPSYVAEASFIQPLAYNIQTHQRGEGLDGVQILGEDGDDSFEFHFSANPDDCHNGYCFKTAVDTYNTSADAWQYLGYIKASNIGASEDELPLQHVFTTTVNGVKIYVASSEDPRIRPEIGFGLIFHTFVFETK